MRNNRNYGTDYVTDAFVEWGVRVYVPSAMEKSDPYISPLHHPFPTKTAIWVQVGGAECLCDDGTKLAANMKAVNGNIVDLYEIPHAVHDIFLAGGALGFRKETAEAVKESKKFIDQLKTR